MAGIFMDVTYGQKITGKNDPLLDALEDGTAAFRLASYPGKFLVDLIPSLRHIPDWFPGANFKRLAKEWEAATFKMIDVPYEMAKQDLVCYSMRTPWIGGLYQNCRVMELRMNQWFRR